MAERLLDTLEGKSAAERRHGRFDARLLGELVGAMQRLPEAISCAEVSAWMKTRVRERVA
jgi:hypothetical protein